ncbi:MAG: DNA repair protein RadA [Anaerolineales bacterium]|nr:DNA repair protein RadA [Anaerolineales bacterium]
MVKEKSVYICQSCGRHSARMMGRCPGCGEWGTLEETVVREPSARKPDSTNLTRAQPQRLADVSFDGMDRLVLPIDEFSRVLGGGIVPGSLVLISGDPGIGKSTLLLQMAAIIAQTAGPVLYASGEESDRQIKMRAARLGLDADDLYVVTETDLETIIDYILQMHPSILVIDSIQTMHISQLESAPGSVSQIRTCAARLQEVAKSTGVAAFLVGHVTKEGVIAGPRVLEHIVDTVLYLEGDRFHTYRLLRAVKNRFGATSEVGVFEMQSQGMVEVSNPSEAFLAERLVSAAGSAIAVTMEGTRPLLVEVQALTSATTFSYPRRTANGVDFNRLLLLSAVLSKRVGIRLHDQDIFVNVVGGLQVREPAVDLAVAAAVASSRKNQPVAADIAFVGEIGLSGELRAVGQLGARLNEAAKLGFRRMIVPKTIRQPADGYPADIVIVSARSLGEALDMALLHNQE